MKISNTSHCPLNSFVHVALVGHVLQACSVVGSDCEAASVFCMLSLVICPKNVTYAGDLRDLQGHTQLTHFTWVHHGDVH